MLREAGLRTRSAVVLIVVLAVSTAIGFLTLVRTARLYPTMDSYAWQSTPDANNGGSNNFQITSASWGPGNMRGYIRFDLSGLPGGAVVLSAELKLRIWKKSPNDPSQNVGDPTGRLYGAFRIVADWEEYEVTWKNQPAYSETDHAYSRVPAGEGGWFANGAVLWMSWDVRSIVSQWISGTKNFGFLVRDLNESSPTLFSTQFFTRDGVPDHSYFPRLEITYMAFPVFSTSQVNGVSVVKRIDGLL